MHTDRGMVDPDAVWMWLGGVPDGSVCAVCAGQEGPAAWTMIHRRERAATLALCGWCMGEVRRQPLGRPCPHCRRWTVPSDGGCPLCLHALRD
ncbi:MAG: hypothetical protein ABR541_06515 [Candidatus Dormibacteria bacterium]